MDNHSDIVDNCSSEKEPRAVAWGRLLAKGELSLYEFNILCSYANEEEEEEEEEAEEKKEYWMGPYDMRIPNAVKSVRWSDGYNTLTNHGGYQSVTEKYRSNNVKPTEKEYLETYATLGTDGFFWYVVKD